MLLGALTRINLTLGLRIPTELEKTKGEAAVKEKMTFTLIALAWAVILLAAYAVAVHAQTSADY